MKAVRFLIAVLLIAAGAVLALYGIFAFVYKDEGSGGPTYIKIAGGEVDAHLAGGLSLALAVVLVAFGIFAVRHRRVHG